MQLLQLPFLRWQAARLFSRVAKEDSWSIPSGEDGGGGNKVRFYFM